MVLVLGKNALLYMLFDIFKGALYSWTDDLPKCQRSGVGLLTNQVSLCSLRIITAELKSGAQGLKFPCC